MGLAVLQQFSEYDNLYQQGMLAALFEEAGGEFKQEPPALRLVDIRHIEENLTHAATSIALAPHSDEERNIEDHADHVKKTVHDYGTKEVIAPISAKEGFGNDVDISTKTGYIKGAHANQAGANERNKLQSSKFAMYLVASDAMRLQQESMERLQEQIERVQRQIARLEAIQDDLKTKNNSDFDINTEKGRANRAKLQTDLTEADSKIQLKDFEDGKGGLDVKEVEKAVQEEKREATLKHSELSDKLNSLEQSQNADNLIAASPAAPETNVLSADFNALSLWETPQADTTADLIKVDNPQTNLIEADNRSYASAASGIDGADSTCVISASFQKAATNAPQTPAPQDLAAVIPQQPARPSAYTIG